MHRRSIPSPAPSFFSTTTTLKAYGLLDSSIIPFLSIISICSSIHLCSFGVWYPIFPTTGTSLTSLIACSTLVQFPISCAPFDTISSYSSRICCTSSGYVSVISLWTQNLILTEDTVTAAPQEIRDLPQEIQDLPQKTHDQTSQMLLAEWSLAE